MATVGLSFGSATSGTGFDVSTTVTSILAIESAVETPWKTQLTAYQAQDTALTTLGTGLSALSTALSALTNFDGTLAQKLGSSSDTNVLTLTAAGTTAVAGSHTITVTSLASTSSQYSGTLGASDVLTGSLSLQVGSGTAATIALPTAGETLTQLAQQINSGAYGVQAGVVTDGSGERLSLVSQTSGAAGQLTVGGTLADGSSNVSFQQGTAGADAVLNVDGLQTTSGSNTVTTAIPGVTFQLLSSAPGTTVQVQITNDVSSVETAVQAVVTAYNTVASALATQEGKDSTGAAEPLFGNSTLALIQNQLSSALLGGAASGAIKSLSQLGITAGQTGQLTLDTSALGSVLNSNFNDVAGFLQNSGSFGQTFTTAVNGLGSSNTYGAVKLALAENATQETGINTDVSNEDARVASDKTKLTTELNAANQILQSIPQQLAEQDEIYAALTGYGEKS